MSPDGYKGATQNQQSITVTIYWLLILQICFFKHENMRYSANRAESTLANPKWSSATQSGQNPAYFSCFQFGLLSCRFMYLIRDQRWENRAGPWKNRALGWEKLRRPSVRRRCATLNLEIHIVMPSLLGKQRKQGERQDGIRMPEC